MKVKTENNGAYLEGLEFKTKEKSNYFNNFNRFTMILFELFSRIELSNSSFNFSPTKFVLLITLNPIISSKTKRTIFFF